MDGVGDFIERVDAFYNDLKLTDDRVFLVKEGYEYFTLDEISATVKEWNETFETLPVFTVTIRDRLYKVYVEPITAEELILRKLEHPQCQSVVTQFKKYHIAESNSNSQMHLIFKLRHQVCR
jgi:hypothetical protein